MSQLRQTEAALGPLRERCCHISGNSDDATLDWSATPAGLDYMISVMSARRRCGVWMLRCELACKQRPETHSLQQVSQILWRGQRAQGY